jgi:tetratricopeptide (TPR) repeat protein
LNETGTNHKASMTSTRFLFPVLLTLIVGLGWGLRLHELGAKSLWYDELVTLQLSAPQDRWPLQDNAPERDLVSAVSFPKEAHLLPAPSLYYVITHLFLRFNTSDFFLRLPSAMLGALTIPVVYLLGKILFDHTIGLCSAFLLSICTFHVRYSQEAFCYAALTFLSALSFYFLCRALMDRRRPWWMAFVVATILNVYTHFFALLVLLSEGLFVLSLALYRLLAVNILAASTERLSKKDRQSDHRSVSETATNWEQTRAFQAVVGKEAVAPFALSLVVGSLVYLPTLPYLIAGLSGSRESNPITVTPFLSTIFSSSTDLLEVFSGSEPVAFYLFLTLFLLGIAAAIKNRNPQIVLFLLWIVVLVFAFLARSFPHAFRARYAIYVLPFYLILVARGVGLFGSAMESPGLEWSQVLLHKAGMISLLAIIALMSVTPLRMYYTERKPPWSSIAAFLSAAVRPGDVVVDRICGALDADKLCIVETAWRHYATLPPHLGRSTFSPKEITRAYANNRGVWIVGRHGREDLHTLQKQLRNAIGPHYVVIRFGWFVPDQDSVWQVEPTMNDLYIVQVHPDLSSPRMVLTETKSLLAQAMAIEPLAVRTDVTLAQTYQRYRRTWGAIDAYERALFTVPRHVALEVHNTLGYLYLMETKDGVDQAIEHYQQATFIHSEDVTAHCGLAAAYRRKGWHDQATTEVEQCRDLRSSSE